jgi:autotransporter adhesin
LSGRIDDVNNAARRGIAATAAMAYAPTPTGPGRTTLAINGSAYENTGGVGVAFQHRFASTRIPVYFSGAYGNGGGREHVGRAGVAIEW